MAYDRYNRDERSRWSEDRDFDRNRRYEGEPGRGRGEDRGFFERMGDEVRSWFGDDEEDHRGRRRDREYGYGGGPRDREYDRGYGRDYDRDRASYERQRSGRDFNQDRGLFNRGGSSEGDYNRSWSRNLWGSGEQDRERSRERGYRPITGDYGRGTHESEQFFAASGVGRGERALGDYRNDYSRTQSPYDRDDYRRTSFAGSRKDNRDFDPHYRDWRDRQVSDLDRDYDEYCRERQSRFESDFGSWREQRQQKRGLLGQVREHMEVVGKDDQHVGTVDRIAGDRIILTKSDEDSGGAHHSLSCSLIDRVEGDRVILDRSADEAKHQWRDENRSRALFEHEDQGEMGPGILDRSFSGTYR